ncbi:MAG: AsmA-like C-terminal domain-containing protein [Sulfurovum sp.]|nr:AsmA-like C-terminal domain-containing protein [Sulfurovum sp.]
MKKASTMLINHTGFIIHNLLRDFLILCIAIAIALFIWLKIGIKADSLVFSDYKVDGLYIKLDKKLTLRAENIIIPKSKAKPSFDSIDKTFDTIKNLFTFFTYIELNNITFDNNHLSVVFADEILYITSDDYEIAGNIHRQDKKFIAEVSMLYLKKKNITLDGTLTYDQNSDVLQTQGHFKAYNIKGDFNAKKKESEVDFNLSTDMFTDLKTLINTFELDKDVNAWIVDKIKASSYKLTTLEAKANVENDTFDIDYETLRGNLVLDKATIRFQEGLKNVLAKKAYIIFKDKRLYFNFDTPTYFGRNLEGSKGYIDGLLEQHASLNLDLNVTSPVDDEIQKILKSYDLEIPVKHKGPNTNVKINMHIPLDEHYPEEENMTTSVQVNVAKGILTYDNLVLPIDIATVDYNSSKKDNIVFDAQLKKGKIHIGKTKFPVLSGKIHYEKEIATLKNVHIKEDWYEGKVSGKINTKKQKGKLTLDAKKITIGGKNKILLLKNKLLPFTVDYSKKVHVKVPALALEIKEKKKGLFIKLNKLKKLKPFLQNIPLKINGGHLNILSRKNDSYTFKGLISRSECFLYEKKNSCYSRIPVQGTLRKNNLDLYAFSKRLHFNFAKSRIKIKNINFDLEKFLKTKKKQKKGKSKKLVILGKNSNIRYKKHTLMLDSYDLELKANGNIKAFGSSDGDIVKLSINGKKFSLKALRIKDKMLHPLINFKGLKDGRYTMKQSGNPDKVMYGQIIVEGGVLNDFKAYNNTLAFINAIPALATFSDPGFSEKGFKIKEGLVDYHLVGNKIFFDSIYIKGSAATIAGKGELNLVKKTIKMDLAIQTAREFGKVIGSLPLLGYILMGKDKSMTIGLQISGRLDKPVVETSAAQDILTLPLQLLKRTLEAPAHILNN